MNVLPVRAKRSVTGIITVGDATTFPFVWVPHQTGLIQAIVCRGRGPAKGGEHGRELS
jgi:hypothetical protein